MQKHMRIFGLLLLIAVALVVTLWIPRTNTHVSAQSQTTTHHDRKSEVRDSVDQAAGPCRRRHAD